MFKEILLSLSGLPSSLGEDISNTHEFENIMHPCEIKMLEHVLSVAKKYKYLKDFIDVNLNGKQIENDSEVKMAPGLYIKALCEGLHESLASYRKDLNTLEDLFNEVAGGASIFSFEMIIIKHEYFLTFLINTIQEIVKKRLKGCQILSHFYDSTLFGYEKEKEASIRISNYCYEVLLNQLKSWFFRGTLIDPYEEFCIQAIEKDFVNDLESTYTPSIMQSVASTELSMGGFTMMHDMSVMKDYVIDLDLFPSYIPVRVANQIRFIGETIVMLSSKKDSSGTQTLENVYGDKAEELKKELESVLLNQNIEKFNVIKFEQTIENLKHYVTKYLWNLIIHKSDLFSHLKNVKDFYLIGWGELFVPFLSKTGPKLQTKVSSFAAKHLNLALLQSFRILMNSDQSVISKFQFTVSKNRNELLLNQLFLNYTPDWPLQVLFTPPIIENYNALFKFLLRLKKTQLDLHKVWLSHTKMKKQPSNHCWRLRQHLMFVVDNLQYYLLADVLESEYVQLVNSIQKSNDFDEIQFAHVMFQANIMSKAFIYSGQTKSKDEFLQGQQNPLSTDIHPVNHLMRTILDICETFCTRIEDREKPQKIELLEEEFNTTVKNLIILMSHLRSLKSNSSEIDQLLLRLDFNKWYTQKFTE